MLIVKTHLLESACPPGGLDGGRERSYYTCVCMYVCVYKMLTTIIIIISIMYIYIYIYIYIYGVSYCYLLLFTTYCYMYMYVYIYIYILCSLLFTQ